MWTDGRTRQVCTCAWAYRPICRRSDVVRRRRRNGSGGSIFPKSDKEGRHAAVATATRSIDLGPLPPPAGSVCLSALRLPSSLCVLRVRSGCVRACVPYLHSSEQSTHSRFSSSSHYQTQREGIGDGNRGEEERTDRNRMDTVAAHTRENHSPVLLSLPSSIHPLSK